MKKLNHVLAFFQSLPVEKRVNKDGKTVAIDFGLNYTLVWKTAGSDVAVNYAESDAAKLVADLEKEGIEVPADVKAKVEAVEEKSGLFGKLPTSLVLLGCVGAATIGAAAFYFFGDAAVEAAAEAAEAIG